MAFSGLIIGFWNSPAIGCFSPLAGAFV
jgi:hypothetical protein